MKGARITCSYAPAERFYYGGRLEATGLTTDIHVCHDSVKTHPGVSVAPQLVSVGHGNAPWVSRQGRIDGPTLLFVLANPCSVVLAETFSRRRRGTRGGRVLVHVVYSETVFRKEMDRAEAAGLGHKVMVAKEVNPRGDTALESGRGASPPAHHNYMPRYMYQSCYQDHASRISSWQEDRGGYRPK